MNHLLFEELNDQGLPEVLEIYNHYVKNTTATFHTRLLSAAQMRKMVFFKNPKYKTFLIKTSGTVCGYVSLHQYKTREAYDGTAEVTVYLKPAYVGKGIGSKAVRFVEGLAREKQIHVLIASICGENLKSIGLFEKHGFLKCAHYKEVGRKFGQLLDVVDYQKILN